MKKEMTLAAQVREAQRVVNSWTEQKRDAVRLEGVDIYATKGVRSPSYSSSLATSSGQTQKR